MAAVSDLILHRRHKRDSENNPNKTERTGKLVYRNCKDGCVFYDTWIETPQATGILEDGCANCKLLAAPPWEVRVVEAFEFCRVPDGAPYWLAAGVGYLKAAEGFGG